MSNRVSMVKRLAVTTALLAAAAGVVHADDSSMDPRTGDSYAYFNGGNLPQGGRPVIATTPSTFRQTNLRGLPFDAYAALSTTGPEYKPAPVIDQTPSTFHRDNPHGLPFSTYAALSSSGSAYPFPAQVAGGGIATNEAPVADSVPREPFGARVARFFHFPHTDQPSSEN